MMSQRGGDVGKQLNSDYIYSWKSVMCSYLHCNKAVLLVMVPVLNACESVDFMPQYKLKKLSKIHCIVEFFRTDDS